MSNIRNTIIIRYYAITIDGKQRQELHCTIQTEMDILFYNAFRYFKNFFQYISQSLHIVLIFHVIVHVFLNILANMELVIILYLIP